MSVLNLLVNCNGIEIDPVIPNLVSSFVKIITIGIPVVLIVMSMLDLLKAVMSEEEQKKALKKLIDRTKYAVLVFLLPSLVSIVLGFVVTDREKFTCVDCFIRGNCSNASENNTKEQKGLVVSPAKANLSIDRTFKLTSNVQDVTYTSKDESIAKVSPDGTVRGMKEGSTTILVETEDGQTKEIPITVAKNAENKNVAVEKLNYDEASYDMVVGETEPYIPEVTPVDADTSKIEYTSTKPNVATVTADGNVTALSEGSTEIQAKTDNAQSKIKINVVKEEIIIPVKSIKVSSSIGLKVGETKALKPVIKPSDATNQNVEYTSSDASVASVDQTGTITALKEGKANIITKVDGKIAITVVTVASKDIAVSSISASESKKTITVNTTYQIQTKIKPSNATNTTLKYSSSDKKIATVSSDGIVKGKKAGKAVITIQSNNKKTTKVTITVKDSNKIHFIKTSASSDCILLESNGKYAMIDTGRKSDYKAIKNYLDNLNVEKLEFLILTHNHGDHVGSAYNIIKKYKPTTLYLKKYHGNDVAGTNGTYIQESVDKKRNRYKEYLAEAKEVGTKIIFLDDKADGYAIQLNKMNLKNYNLENHLIDSSPYAKVATENVNSISTLVTIGSIKTYLTSDLSYESVANPIAEKIGKVDVYKVTHHGYIHGTSEVEAGIVRPKYAIVTNTRALLKEKETTAIPRITKYTNKLYYSGENTIIVDYSNKKVQITKK